MKKEQVFSPEILSSPHCLLHGSMRKHLQQMYKAYEVFRRFGIEVTPDLSRNVISGQDDFVLFDGEKGLVPSLVEGRYLQNIYRNNPINFSYFVNPDGYMGQSASFELGITTSNTPIFFLEKPQFDSYYLPENSIWSPYNLASYIKKHNKLPQQSIKPEEWQDLNTHKSVVAVGAVIEWQPKQGNEKQVLLVQTHKWGNRFSIVGEKMERGELAIDRWKDISQSEFFEMILRHTMQGFYGSPRHGGNKNYVSYRMMKVDFPLLIGQNRYEK